MRTFATYEVCATKCSFTGKKRQLRIGTSYHVDSSVVSYAQTLNAHIKLTVANPTYALLPEKSLNFSVHFDILC